MKRAAFLLPPPRSLSYLSEKSLRIMMKLFVPCILFAFLWNLPAEFRSYQALRQANMLYRNGAYADAEQRCREALSDGHADTASHKSAIRFNLAGSLAMQEKYLPARILYRSLAENPGAASIRNASLYNEGTCLAQEGLATENIERKKAFFEMALQRYTNVLLKNPNDKDARINYEIVLRMLEKLKTGSGGSEKSLAGQHKSVSSANGSINAAERLLRQAQIEESRTMRRIPQAISAGQQDGQSGRKEW